MGNIKLSHIVTASVTMLLCAAYNTVFNILRRASHLLSTVRDAATWKSDVNAPSVIKGIAFSIYDAAAVFNLSSGMLAAIQALAAIVGIIYVLRCAFGKKPLKGAFLPCTLGVVCTLLGTASMFTLISSRSAGMTLTVVLVLTQLVVPILFTYEAKRFDTALSTTHDQTGRTA